MKKLIYTVALVVMGITASYAQKPGRELGKPKGTPEQRAEIAATAMQQKLGLTADQKVKIQQIELDRIKKSEEWRQKDAGNMKDKMEERKSFMKANKDKMYAILTPDQQKTYEASRKEMRGKFRDGKGRKGSKKDKSPAPASSNN